MILHVRYFTWSENGDSPPFTKCVRQDIYEKELDSCKLPVGIFARMESKILFELLTLSRNSVHLFLFKNVVQCFFIMHLNHMVVNMNLRKSDGQVWKIHCQNLLILWNSFARIYAFDKLLSLF